MVLLNDLAAAGLEFVSPFAPGIRRTRTQTGFEYRDQHDNMIADAVTLQRIKKLAIPPAWSNVWISPNPVGHIQATGFDRAGRKQYRYHTAWRDLRDREKFDAIVSFGETLPLIREAVAADLSSDGLEHKQVLGCAARLLDLGSFRIGSDRYAVDDDTHGLTMLLAREVQLDGEVISFRYVGKEHIRQVQHVVDPDARRVVAQLLNGRDPDQRLFAFTDGGHWVELHAGDVNHYLKEAAGMSASAKEFRTWNATVLGASTLAGLDPPGFQRAMERAFRAAVMNVDDYLGNTPTVARHSYVDPRIFERYRTGWMIHPEIARLGVDLEAQAPVARRPVELAVLNLIQERWDAPGVLRIERRSRIEH
jgi:DNA topoisomerase I